MILVTVFIFSHPCQIKLVSRNSNRLTGYSFRIVSKQMALPFLISSKLRSFNKLQKNSFEIKIVTVKNPVVACSREILKNICFHLTACSFSLLCSWFKSFNAFVITEHLSYVLTECEVIFRLQIVDQLLLNVRISKNDISNNSLMIFYNKISLS